MSAPTEVPTNEQERDRWQRARSDALRLVSELDRVISAHRCGSDLDEAIEATLDTHQALERELLGLKASTCYHFDRWLQADPQIEQYREAIVESVRAGCPHGRSGDRLARLIFYPTCSRP